jgi:hypothetical protein
MGCTAERCVPDDIVIWRAGDDFNVEAGQRKGRVR